MSSWRDLPPTEAQERKLPELGALDQAVGCTRGQVSDLIDASLQERRLRADEEARSLYRASQEVALAKLFAGIEMDDDDLSLAASALGFRVYGSHYLTRDAWKLQKPFPGSICGNCRSSSMTSACWCDWETITSGIDGIRAHLVDCVSDTTTGPEFEILLQIRNREQDRGNNALARDLELAIAPLVARMARLQRENSEHWAKKLDSIVG